MSKGHRQLARMYPDQFNPQTKSEAERRLYDVFRTRLDNSYIVYHAVHWLANDQHGQPRDGEADFIIAHPALGILVMEVKGGGIRRDLGQGTWTSTGTQGTFTIKDPVEQARQGKYTLLAQLKTMLRRLCWLHRMSILKTEHLFRK